MLNFKTYLNFFDFLQPVTRGVGLPDPYEESQEDFRKFVEDNLDHIEMFGDRYVAVAYNDAYIDDEHFYTALYYVYDTIFDL